MNWLLPLLLVATIQSPSVRIAEVHATADAGTIDIWFRSEGLPDAAGLQTALSSGAALTLRFDVELVRKRSNWFDSTLDDAQVELVSTYNPITRDYLLNYRIDGKLIRSEILGDAGELLKRLGNVRSDDIFRITRNPAKLRVRIRAENEEGYFLHVIPWQQKTGWRVARIHPADAPG